ncbi:MAG: hypothetical protein NTY35_13560 [Planctomycetota bacterium]|nr:hypothetical protein [Planctomycetota bacterium]
MKNRQSLLLAILSSSLTAALVTSGCSGGSSGSENVSFVVRSTNVATSGATPVRISGAYVAFLAAEDATSSPGSPGTILNGDMDVSDQVAHVVNTATNTQFRLGVAAQDLAWAGSELYLVVDEAVDGRDWNDDMLQQDDVLLHWSQTANMLQRVDDLATNASLSVIGLGSRILYAAKTATPGAGGSNLRFVESSAPLIPIPVATADLGPDPLFARLLGEDERLVFLAFDETLTQPPRSLNGDVDFLDANVLGLLDGTGSASVARSTGRAVDPASPRRAKSIATGDWHVGFLVSEAGQGGASLNSSAVGANFRACATNDVDTTDQVLAVLTFAAWDANPTTNPPVNHGLPGRDRIAFAGNYVATIVSEADDNCDLNNDGSANDTVVRWLAIADLGDPILPINTAAQVRALFDAPGGSHGLTELSNSFVIVASEATGGDIDGNNGLDANLVGFLAPSPSSAVWTFLHIENVPVPYVEASWISDRESEGRLGVGYTERVGGVSLNQGSAQVPGDNDLLDAIPAFVKFSGPNLIFPRIGVALNSDSAGFTTSRGIAFYRAAENEDSRDLNADNDEADFILERTNVSSGATAGMSVASDFARPVVEVARFGSVECGALIASEAQQGSGGTDFNGDGDRTDLVLRWFRF